MNKLNIFFFGTADFGTYALEKIVKDSPHNILKVITLTDRIKGRNYKKIPTPIKQKALELNLELLEVESAKDPKIKEAIEQLKPDLCIVIAFQIIPAEILKIPKYGFINLHASKLPKYRGPAPINYALLNGEHETGNTVFFLNENIDDGEILLQSTVKIEPTDNFETLYYKLAKDGADLILKSLELISSGKFSTIKQDKNKITYAPKIKKEDTIIDWNKSALEVYNHIRAFSPTPGAMTTYREKILKILETKISELKPHNQKAGEIFYVSKNQLTVTCGQGAIDIIKVKPQNSKEMSITEFINGYKPKINEQFL